MSTNINKGVNNGIMGDGNVVYLSKNDLGEFEKEINSLISEVSQIKELTKEQKGVLVDILDKSKTSVEKNEKNQQELCKIRFSDFIKNVGNASGKVLDFISKLTTVSKFFSAGV